MTDSQLIIYRDYLHSYRSSSFAILTSTVIRNYCKKYGLKFDFSKKIIVYRVKQQELYAMELSESMMIPECSDNRPNPLWGYKLIKREEK